MEANLVVFSLLLILASFPIRSYCDEDVKQQYPDRDRDCTYVIYVQTGDIQNAGTYAKVSLQLRDQYANLVNITYLQSWGIKGQWRDYFSRGNLDVFAVKGRCLEAPVCSITLSHDNSGYSPNWYVDYVYVTSISPRRHHIGCQGLEFPVNAWLAFDMPPYYSPRHGVYLCDDVPFAGGDKVKGGDHQEI